MLTALVFDADQVATIADPDQISEERARSDTLVWVDLEDPTGEDYDWIEREFELHPLAMTNARKRGQRPKLDRYGSHSFLVLYASAPDHPGDLPEVDVFVGSDWLVTVRTSNRTGDRFDLGPVLERFERTRDGTCAVGFLLYSILDEVVFGYFDAIDRVENDIEELEGRIFLEARHNEPTIQRDLLRLRRELLELRRRTVPMRDIVLSILRREVSWVDEHNLVYFQDVFNHLMRALDQIDTQRELLASAVDAHLASISNRLNEIMKKMTSWGAILIGVSVVTGFYGMNFRNVPLLDSEVGYLIAIAMMVAIVVGGYVYFKRKDWL